MEAKLNYFKNKIEKCLEKKNFQEAKYYYDKAIFYLGNNDNILAYKPQIETGLKNHKQAEIVNEKPIQEKNKFIDEKKIVIPIIFVALIGFFIYYFGFINPVNRLKSDLSDMWYQGETKGFSADVTLQLDEDYDGNYVLKYNNRLGSSVDLKCEILSGSKILVNDREIKVEIDGDYLTFYPSIIGLAEKSVWRNDATIYGEDKTGEFGSSIKDTSTYKDSSTVSTSTTKKDCLSGHDFVDITEQVKHDEVGHYEEVTVDYESVEKYKCSFCDYGWTASYDDIAAHFNSAHDVTGRDLVMHYCYNSYDMQPVTEKQWVVDKEAYTETVVTGQKCSRCGTVKE